MNAPHLIIFTFCHLLIEYLRKILLMNNYILLLLLSFLAACGNTDTTPQAGIVTNAPATAVQTATVSPSATKKSDKELESPDIKITIKEEKRV